MVQKNPFSVVLFDRFLQLKSNFATNKEAMGAFGEPFIPMPQLHTIRAKIKF
ncbi:MAG: hypothetical protein ACI9SG_000877 [Maribacter sp.]